MANGTRRCALFVVADYSRVSDVSALDEVYNVLGDVCRVVGYSLKMSRDENQRQCPLDGSGVADHVCDQLAYDLAFESVNLVIGREPTGPAAHLP